MKGRGMFERIQRRRTAQDKACDGISTEALESGVVSEMVDLLEAVQERCALIKQMNGSHGHWGEVAEKTRSLLSKIKGENP